MDSMTDGDFMMGRIGPKAGQGEGRNLRELVL